MKTAKELTAAQGRTSQVGCKHLPQQSACRQLRGSIELTPRNRQQLTPLEQGRLPGATLHGADVTVADATHPAITFPHLTGAGAPTYEVQKSADLKTWTTVWQTSDTFAHALVASSSTDGETTTLTVRTPEPFSSPTPCHLRIKTTYPAP